MYAPGTPNYDLSTAAGRLFVAVEIDTYLAGTALAGGGLAIAEGAIGEEELAVVASDAVTVRASDMGYVSLFADTPSGAVYPPTLAAGFSSNVTMDLNPGGSRGSVAWGTLDLIADDRRYDAGLLGSNADRRTVRVLAGKKTYDTTRRRWVDPAYATLATLFTGLGAPWTAVEGGISLPVRDASAYLERPFQTKTYGGTGGYDGYPELAGRLLPRLRGGSAASPVQNIAPVLIDQVNNIWQYSDAPGAIVAMYEDGATTLNNSGTTTDLYSGTTPAGFWRSDNTRSMFQLGSPAAGAITIDARGSFPIAGAVSLASDVAYRMALEDMAIPTALLNTIVWSLFSIPNPYIGGWYWDGTSAEDGATAIARLLSSIGAAAVPLRDGRLTIVGVRTLLGGTPSVTYTEAELVRVRRIALPPSVSPPPYRIRWGYGHNFNVQASGLNPTTTTAHRAFAKEADRFAAASNALILAAWRRPNDLPPIPTALCRRADAQEMADLMISLWGTERRLYSVDVPLQIALRHDVGDYISIAYPIEDLDSGKTAQIVGESIRTAEELATLICLV